MWEVQLAKSVSFHMCGLYLLFMYVMHSYV